MSRMIALVVLATAATSAIGAGSAQAAELPCTELSRFSAATFPAVPVVNSTLLPLVPGTQRVYAGRSNVSGQALPHQVTFTVTDLTKVIAGVRTVVVHDVDLTSGVLAEEELSFWAQDRFGNVWNIGEYPEEHLTSGIIRAPSVWMAGTSGAVPGIHMPADAPRPGGAFYLQGSVPKIGFLDCAETFLLNTSSCVPVGCFNGVLISDETSPLDANSGIQRKSYAPGIGIVDITFLDDPQGERLVLSQFNRLDEGALAPIRAAALAEDVRAIATNGDYRSSPPIEPLVRPAAAAGTTAPAPVLEPADVRPPARRIGAVSLVLGSAADHAGRSGAVSLRVSCAIAANRPVAHPGACRGALDVVLHGARVGTARFSVAGGLRRTVRVPLAPHALRALRALGRLHVVAATRGARAGGRQVTAARTLTLTL